jgi:outer membrane protein, heavy metal efflux system
VDYLSEKQRVGVFAEAVDSARHIVESGKVRGEADNSADYDFEAKAAHHVRAKAELARAKTRAIQARERINQILGLTGPQIQWRSAERLPSVPARDPLAAHLEDRAIEASFDLAIMRQRLVTLVRNLGGPKGKSFLQGGSAGGRWELGRKYQVVNVTSLLPQLDVGGMARRVNQVDQAGPSFRLEVPLFDWGQARREAAQMEILKARDEFTAVAVQVQSLARLHQTKLRSARQTALFYADNVVPQSRRLLDTAKRKYDAMQLGVFELLEAEEAHVRVGLDNITALTTYWQERVRLAQILTGKLPEEADGADAGVMLRRAR